MAWSLFCRCKTDQRVLDLLTQILANTTAIRLQENRNMTKIADLQAQADKTLAAIAAETTIDNSIVALVTANTAQIADLRQQLQDAIDNGASSEALQSVLDKMVAAETAATSNAAAVAAAVQVNTPAAPPAPPVE